MSGFSSFNLTRTLYCLCFLFPFHKLLVFCHCHFKICIQTEITEIICLFQIWNELAYNDTYIKVNNLSAKVGVEISKSQKFDYLHYFFMIFFCYLHLQSNVFMRSPLLSSKLSEAVSLIVPQQPDPVIFTPRKWSLVKCDVYFSIYDTNYWLINVIKILYVIKALYL
jgi:hypothetical protein